MLIFNEYRNDKISISHKNKREWGPLIFMPSLYFTKNKIISKNSKFIEKNVKAI